MSLAHSTLTPAKAVIACAVLMLFIKYFDPLVQNPDYSPQHYYWVSRVAQLVEQQIINRLSLASKRCVYDTRSSSKLCYAVHLHRKDVGLLPVLTHWP